MVFSSPPRVVQVVPYLALNRDPFDVPLPTLDEEEIVEDEPFTGAREVEWSPPDREGVVVDDLDDGFSVEETGGRSLLRLGGSGGDQEMDAGLPVARFGPRSASGWSRWTMGNAYGRYRHTTAVVNKGGGRRTATFAAEIPEAGEWELQYYLPRMRGPGGRGGPDLGTWTLTVADDRETREVTFDADGGEPGWNSLGSFSIDAGEVRVVVSDATEGDFVLADAVRWTPAGP
jgi:hypothetical protein